MFRGMLFILGVALIVGCNRHEAEKNRQAGAPSESGAITGAAMDQASKQAGMVKSASHLRYVGKALNAYAAAHGGAWPNALGDIASSDELLDPSDIKSPMADRSYVYRKPDASALASAVVVFEQPSAKSAARDGVNVLHRDGSVELITGDEAEKIVAEK